MATLPAHSHFRKPLLSHLAINIPVSKAAQMFQTSPSTVKQSVSPTNASISSILPSVKYTPHTKRKRVSDDEIQKVKTFIKEICPVKSGDKRGRPRQYDTDNDLW